MAGSGKYRTILWLSIVYCLGSLTLACHGHVVGHWYWTTHHACDRSRIDLYRLGRNQARASRPTSGDQFGESNKHLLSKMFGWFYFSINAGSFISSIICPWMLANGALGPRWAFGIPGISMVIATIFFWAGRNKMVHVPPRGLGYLREAFLTREGLAILGRIAMVYFFILFFWALWGMSNGVEWTLQAEKMDLRLAGHESDRRPGANGQPYSHSDLHSADKLFDLSRNRPRLSASRRCARSALVCFSRRSVSWSSFGSRVRSIMV